MNKTPIFSIIIPVRHETEYLKETILHIKKQSFTSFEILVITDKISGALSPAFKRNLGAKKAKGKYLAFLDDDSYPSRDWLKNANKLLSKNIAALCGPCLTPPNDNDFQKASGLVWSSKLGSGGAGTYRNSIQKKRFVDDFPSVNLIVKKEDFNKVKGFNTHHWPGEDTILCSDLVYKLHKKILYHPEIIVYHHRRAVIWPHLQQITRYALHRGNFARVYPKTSFLPGYLAPSLSIIYLFLFPLLFPIIHQYFFLPILIYIFSLIVTFFNFLVNKNSFIASFFASLCIPITHFYYGILFIIGYFSKKLVFIPHKIDHQNGNYLGG